MGINRNEIFAALFTQIASNVKIRYQRVSRRFIPWQESSGAIYPCISQFEGPTYQITQTSTDAGFGLPVYTLVGQIWCYAQANPSTNPNNVPSAQANAMLDDVEAALNAGLYSGRLQTLGGLVTNAWVEGTGYVDPGVANSGLIIAMTPIKIILGGA